MKKLSILFLILAFAISSCRRNREEAPAPSSTPEVVPETVIEAEPEILPEADENIPAVAPKAGKTTTGSAKTKKDAPVAEKKSEAAVESGNTEETSATEVDLAEQEPVNVVKDTCDFLVKKQDSTENSATAAAPVPAATTTITADQTEPSVKNRGGFWFDVSLETGNEFCYYKTPDNKLVEPFSPNGHTVYGTTVAFGYRLLPQLALGGGIGINGQIKNDVVKIYDGNLQKDVEHRALVIPVFARLRYNVLTTTVSPYLNLDLGYAIPTLHGYFMNCPWGAFAKLDVGVSANTGEGYRLYAGCKSGIIMAKENWYDSNVQSPGTWLAIPLVAKIGFEF